MLKKKEAVGPLVAFEFAIVHVMQHGDVDRDRSVAIIDDRDLSVEWKVCEQLAGNEHFLHWTFAWERACERQPS